MVWGPSWVVFGPSWAVLGCFWASSGRLRLVWSGLSVRLFVLSVLSVLFVLSGLGLGLVWSGLLRVSVWPLVAVLGRLVFFFAVWAVLGFFSFLGLVSDPRQGPIRFVKQNVFGNFRVCPNVCLKPCMRRVFARPLATSSPTATCFDNAPSSYALPVHCFGAVLRLSRAVLGCVGASSGQIQEANPRHNRQSKSSLRDRPPKT